MDEPTGSQDPAVGSLDPAAPTAPGNPAAPSAGSGAVPPTFSWKSQIPQDFANSPTIKQYNDDKDGLATIIKSHLSLEKMLGHEKVPVPKGKDDVEGWANFKKAFAIPEKPDGYKLADPKLPESMKGITFDKTKFSEIVHANNLTPDQANALWNMYLQENMDIYSRHVKAHEDNVKNVINQMRGEWGDAYETKVELGQMVINKFASDQEMNDFITATLVKDPRGIKFLAKIGDQFAENKIGEFKYSKHSLTPDEAQNEIDQIRRDPNHPYNNDKATPAERDRAIDYVNNLLTAVNKRPRG